MTPPLIMDWKMLTDLSLQATVSRKKEVEDRGLFIDGVNHIRRYLDHQIHIFKPALTE
jgi:hypothetical protein